MVGMKTILIVEVASEPGLGEYEGFWFVKHRGNNIWDLWNNLVKGCISLDSFSAWYRKETQLRPV